MYNSLYVAVSPQCPLGDWSANPASVPGCSGLQRAHLSVSSARKCSGTERLAAPSGVLRAARAAVPCRSSTSGHQASSSKHTSGQFLETDSLSRGFVRFALGAKHANVGSSTRNLSVLEGRYAEASVPKA